MIRSIVIFSLCMATLLNACTGKGHQMEINGINWKSLDFVCTQEKNPRLDAQADELYRAGRTLQQKDQDKNIKTIVAFFEQAVEKNHYNAMHRLALLYIEGSEGFPVDEQKAVDLVERVIELNVASGYYQMGVFLEQGVGVKQDRAAALKYMRKAADMGSPQAQLSVGKNLLSVPTEPERSHAVPIGLKMLECSLKHGSGEAGLQLGVYYEHSDMLKAMRFYQEAGKLGNTQALFMLADIFKAGRNGISGDDRRFTCYDELWRKVDSDKSLKLPDLDKICPLPPSSMPAKY